MTANRTGEEQWLQVAAFADQAVDVVAMGNALHVLIEDGPLIEPRGGIVRSRIDVLHPTFAGLVVGLLSHDRPARMSGGH